MRASFFSSSFFRPPLLGPSSSFEGEREREREERGGCFPFSSSLLLFLLIRHTRIQNSNSLFFEEGWKEGGEPERVLFPFCRSPGRAAAFFFFPFLSLSFSFLSLSSLFLLSFFSLFPIYFPPIFVTEQRAHRAAHSLRRKRGLASAPDNAKQSHKGDRNKSRRRPDALSLSVSPLSGSPAHSLPITDPSSHPIDYVNEKIKKNQR